MFVYYTTLLWGEPGFNLTLPKLKPPGWKQAEIVTELS